MINISTCKTERWKTQMVKITKATETRLRSTIGEVENAEEQYALASSLVESGARVQNIINVIDKYKDQEQNWYELESQYKGKDVYLVRDNDEYSLKTPPHKMEPKYLRTAQQAHKIAENGQSLDPILFELDTIENKQNIPKEFETRIKEAFKVNDVEINKFNGQDLSIVSYGKTEQKAMIVRRPHTDENFDRLNQQVSNWPNAEIYQVVVDGESEMSDRQLQTLEKSTRNITVSYVNGDEAKTLVNRIAKHIEPQAVITVAQDENEVLITNDDLNMEESAPGQAPIDKESDADILLTDDDLADLQMIQNGSKLEA